MATRRPPLERRNREPADTHFRRMGAVNAPTSIALFAQLGLDCPGCGDNRFALPLEGEDSDVVGCESCGAPLGTIGQLKERLVQAVLSRGEIPDAVPAIIEQAPGTPTPLAR